MVPSGPDMGETSQQDEQVPGFEITGSEGSADFGYFRGVCEKILKHEHFDTAIALIIMFNLVLVIFETDADAQCVTDGLEDLEACPVAKWVTVANTISIAIFLIELVARIFVFGTKFFKNTWNAFDAIIVILTTISQYVGAFRGISTLRMFKIVRVLRCLRIVSSIRELYVIVHGFVSVIKAITWASIVVCWLLTVWSIVAVVTIHPSAQFLTESGYFEQLGCERCPRAFSSVWQANITFFQTLIAGDSWGVYCVPIIEHDPRTAIVFFGITVTMGLGMMNLVLAVIVDSAAAAREDDIQHQSHERQVALKDAQKSLGKLFSEMDVDRNDHLTLSELVGGYERSDAFRSVLNFMEIDYQDLVALYNILDTDKDGSVSKAEFLSQLFKMKSTDNRTILTFIKFYQLEMINDIKHQLHVLKSDVLGNLLDVQDRLTLRRGKTLDTAAMGKINHNLGSQQGVIVNEESASTSKSDGAELNSSERKEPIQLRGPAGRNKPSRQEPSAVAMGSERSKLVEPGVWEPLPMLPLSTVPDFSLAHNMGHYWLQGEELCNITSALASIQASLLAVVTDSLSPIGAHHMGAKCPQYPLPSSDVNNSCPPTAVD